MATNQIKYEFKDNLGNIVQVFGFASGTFILLSNINKSSNGLKNNDLFFPFNDKLGNVVDPQLFIDFATDNGYTLIITDFVNGGGSSSDEASPSAIDIHFKIVNGFGVPLEGASVYLTDLADDELTEYRVDTTTLGLATFEGVLPKGKYKLIVHKLGYGEWTLDNVVSDVWSTRSVSINDYWSTRSVAISDENLITIAMRESHTIRVTVDDGTDPIENARVELWDGLTGIRKSVSYTSSTGTTSVTTPNGSLQLIVKAVGFEDKLVDKITVSYGDVSRTVHLVENTYTS